MATINNEPIFIGIDENRIELNGDEKNEFIADREAMNNDKMQREAKIAEEKQVILDKLGITAEEAKLLLS